MPAPASRAGVLHHRLALEVAHPSYPVGGQPRSDRFQCESVTGASHPAVGSFPVKRWEVLG